MIRANESRAIACFMQIGLVTMEQAAEITSLSEKKKRGKPRTKAPKFPLQAKKMDELFKALGDISNGEFGRRIGGISRGPVSSWHRGASIMEEWAMKLIAYEFGVPCSWWQQEDVPIAAVIGTARPHFGISLLGDSIDSQLIGRTSGEKGGETIQQNIVNSPLDTDLSVKGRVGKKVQAILVEKTRVFADEVLESVLQAFGGSAPDEEKKK